MHYNEIVKNTTLKIRAKWLTFCTNKYGYNIISKIEIVYCLIILFFWVFYCLFCTDTYLLVHYSPLPTTPFSGLIAHSVFSVSLSVPLCRQVHLNQVL